MLKLPGLAADGLRIIGLCVHVDVGPETPSIGDDLTAISKVGDSGGESILARKIVDSDEKTCHFHLEVGLESAMPQFGDAATPEEVLTPPSSLRGISASVTTWARFRVARSSIPESSVIRILSGVSVPSPSRGYELTITGCTLDVSGDGPLQELRWWPASDADIFLELSAHCDITIDDRLLLNALEVLDDGFGQFAKGTRPVKEIRRDDRE